MRNMLEALIKGFLFPLRHKKSFLAVLLISFLISLIGIFMFEAFFFATVKFFISSNFVNFSTPKLETLLAIFARNSLYEISAIVIGTFLLISLAIFATIIAAHAELKRKTTIADLKNAFMLGFFVNLYFCLLPATGLVFFIPIAELSIVLFFLTALILILIAIRVFLFAPAALASGRKLKEAFEKSVEVTSRKFWQTLAMAFIIFITLTAISLAFKILNLEDITSRFLTQSILLAYSISYVGSFTANYFSKISE